MPKIKDQRFKKNRFYIFLVFVTILLSSELKSQTTAITDSRDGKTYKTVRLGNRWWMAQNLNYGSMINGSSSQTNNGTPEKYCYNNLAAYCDTFGALYQFNELMNYSGTPGVQGLCPSGWHVPTDAEWLELEKSLGMSSAEASINNAWRGDDEGDKLKLDGSSGFMALMEGYRNTGGSFGYNHEQSYFWTSNNYSRYISDTVGGIYRAQNADINNGYALRCVMDPPFTEVSSTLPQLRNSSVSWADYDNDGDMDLYLAGESTYPNFISDIYTNDGSGTLTALGLSIEMTIGSADWGDFDCDGDLDLLIAGYNWSEAITRLYRNDGGGVFSNYTINLPGGRYAKWGDYDNDGDPDILIYLDNTDVNIYENKGTGSYQRNDIYFSLSSSIVSGLNFMSFDWGDYNNDGLLDIAITGSDEISNKYCYIFKNTGNKTFIKLGIPLRGNSNGKISWCDFNNDNLLDLMLTGLYADAIIHKNMGNDNFIVSNTKLAPFNSKNSWIDFNNDGNPDIMLTGLNSSVYEGNGQGNFDSLYCSIAATPNEIDVDFADIDNDNDLDFICTGYVSFTNYTRIFRNNTKNKNYSPQIPSGLMARQVGPDVVFSWEPSTDSETGHSVSYNIRVGTTSSNCIIVSPMSNLSNGKRLKLNNGNVGFDTSWVLKNAPLGQLYWSVQAVDKTFNSSAWAVIQTLEVLPPFTDSIINKNLSSLLISDNVFVDYNNDNLLDIITSCAIEIPKSKSCLFNYQNTGNNSFVQGTISTPHVYGKIIPSNLNNDDHMDAIVYGYTNIDLKVAGLYSLIYTDANSFEVSSAGFENIVPWSLTKGDFNNDGRNDIVFYGKKNGKTGTYILSRNDTSGYDLVDLNIIFNQTEQDIFAVDIDNDLDLDIVYGNSVIINDSVFIVTDLLPFKFIYDMDWSDYDGDGDMDVAVYGTDSIDNSSCKIFRNEGNYIFVDLGIQIESFSYDGIVKWIDFNNDGLTDLATDGIRAASHNSYILQ